MDQAFFLFSTPTSFDHSFKGHRIRIQQVSTNIGEAEHFRHRGPFEHHFYVLGIPVAETDKPGVSRFELDPDDVLALLSLFFGKRIINHGAIFLPPLLSLPSFQNVRPNPYHDLPVFSGAHAKVPIQNPDWRAVAQIEKELEELAAPACSRPDFIAAARAYADSIRLLPMDRELAYLRLIQALESAGSRQSLHDGEKFAHDTELVKHLTWLDGMSDPQGQEVAGLLRRRLFQVKRGVWIWIRARIDQAFYSEENGALSPEGLERAVSAAYDLRSGYVHGGTRFGDWVDPREGRCQSNEVVPSDFAQICEDKDLRRILTRCPSFVGLERLVRYSLHKEFGTPEANTTQSGIP
jgi:hypothetical protein